MSPIHTRYRDKPSKPLTGSLVLGSITDETLGLSKRHVRGRDAVTLEEKENDKSDRLGEKDPLLPSAKIFFSPHSFLT